MHGDIQSSSLNLISFDLFHFPQPLSFLYGAGKALCGNRGRTRREHPSPKVLDEKSAPQPQRVFLHAVMKLRAGKKDRLILPTCRMMGNPSH